MRVSNQKNVVKSYMLKKENRSNANDLVRTYVDKLDREHVLAAKERITIQKLVDKVTNG